MREIKFDVMLWDGKDKNTIEHLTFNEALNEDCIGFNENGGIIPSMEYIIIRQFTGLKDKNGKEIYESDILKWQNGKGMVEYNDLNGMFMIDGIWSFNDEYKTWKVIGNIYENSNLLGESK